MKKLLLLFLLVLSFSCSSDVNVMPVSTVKLSIDFCSGIMNDPRRIREKKSAQADSIYFNIFKPAMESGELTSNAVHLVFKTTEGERIVFDTSIRSEITLPVGKYFVTGGTTDASSSANWFGSDKCPLSISDSCTISTETTNITLRAYAQYSLVFSKDHPFDTYYYTYSNSRNHLYTSKTFENIYYGFFKPNEIEFVTKDSDKVHSELLFTVYAGKYYFLDVQSTYNWSIDMTNGLD